MPGICFASSWHTMFYILQCMICNFVQRHLVVSFSYPKWWHDISNTNIYIQLIHIPKWDILPPLCPNGTQKPYGTLRTEDIEDSDVEDKTLRTGDIEDRRLWGQTFLYKTLRTDIEDKHFPQLNIYFIYFIFDNIDYKYYIIHCGQTLRQTLSTDICSQ